MKDITTTGITAPTDAIEQLCLRRVGNCAVSVCVPFCMPSNAPDGYAASTLEWSLCGHSDDPVGCRGRRVEPYAECLAHLSDANRSSYLAGLQPGSDVDHCGTPFTDELLSELLTAVTASAAEGPCLGSAGFKQAKFIGDARFDRVEIRGDARFDGAVVHGNARFCRVKIRGTALFSGAQIGGHALFDWAQIDSGALFSGMTIEGDARFERAEIGGTAAFYRTEIGGNAGFNWAKIDGMALFDEAKISGDAPFRGVRVGGDARFNQVEIGGDTGFSGAEIGGNARFGGVVFERASTLGPLVCAKTLDLSEAVFATAVTIEAAATALRCRRTRWASTAVLRLRHATVDLSDAVLEFPVNVAAHHRPFAVYGKELAEPGLTDSRVRAVSVRGVDAVHLVLTDVDLTECLFTGAVHLDQLHLEGRCTLAFAPLGVRWCGVRLVRWTPRRTLAEEQHWRAGQSTDADRWTPAPEQVGVLEPAALAPTYRHLRKAFEDGKNEPGAADFYYGEMEMRRHDPAVPHGERVLLAAYWALSGYGLRASRALGWLLAAMTATVLAMMLWGLPQDEPKPRSTGTLTSNSITLTTETPEPVNPEGPYEERISVKRFEKALRVVINSVVFRSSGQELTIIGTYTEMVSRVAEPVLLGLAGLAIRSRVKR
ncbi:pentapeptide repeat-containing protein [Streptomyces angustmyceticus]|uniref:pentapeptide repeat-containing protein n=1 Tax=Streptomyces angustmyceticus TaxID=285578 RepID=UPI00344E15C9